MANAAAKKAAAGELSFSFFALHALFCLLLTFGLSSYYLPLFNTQQGKVLHQLTYPLL
jgi:hypothetical protein